MKTRRGIVHSQNMIGPLMWERARFDHCLVLLTCVNCKLTVNCKLLTVNCKYDWPSDVGKGEI